ncbi:hypothetical protein [Profundibacter amoris]|uniref:Uncharacterized protein n=1 Tax=Profundibacter amoris TaxID=2171755 RepID=A0A347UIZ4_9RHOB|nr:hypothetical protein [Profundibacter amoris]AXX98822.1 hypothetical protein BAR1_13340 [Profundibacter amoris]
MTISKDLFLAILSMDSYNRGYGAGIELSDAVDTQIGGAKISKTSEQIAEMSAEAQAAGFYAIAYDVDGSGPSGLADKTVVPNQTSRAGLTPPLT